MVASGITRSGSGDFSDDPGAAGTNRSNQARSSRSGKRSRRTIRQCSRSTQGLKQPVPVNMVAAFAIVSPARFRSLAERQQRIHRRARSSPDLCRSFRLAGRDSGPCHRRRIAPDADRGITAHANAAGDSILRLCGTIVSSSAAAVQIATLTRQRSVGSDRSEQRDQRS